MGAGLFTNDLFNGEALSGPRLISNRGIFRANLFDAQPLGQTTPDSASTPPDAASGGKTATASGGKSGSAAGASGSKTGSAPPMPSDFAPSDAVYAGGEGEFPWLPVALVGGGLVLTVGAIMLFTGKKKAPTENRRRRR